MDTLIFIKVLWDSPCTSTSAPDLICFWYVFLMYSSVLIDKQHLKLINLELCGGSSYRSLFCSILPPENYISYFLV